MFPGRTLAGPNADGEGDYFGGIEPVCTVSDDLLHRLGDPEEAQLGAALRLLDGQTCEVAEPAPEEKSAASTPSEQALDKRSGPSTPPRNELPPGKFPDLPGWY